MDQIKSIQLLFGTLALHLTSEFTKFSQQTISNWSNSYPEALNALTRFVHPIEIKFNNISNIILSIFEKLDPKDIPFAINFI